MKYLFDTNICAYLLNDSSIALRRSVEEIEASDIAVSAVTSAELHYGAWRSARVADNTRLIEQFLAPLSVVPFDDACSVQYGRLRAHLESQGTPIGPNDMLIAATAVSHGLVLITANVREFSRVVGLRLEDWTAVEPGPPNPVHS